jgi:DNA polymerase-3 subunit delta
MITTLTGENNFELEQDLHKIIDEFINQFGDLALERIDGEGAEFSRISEAITSLPFLASKKLVIFRNPSTNKDFVDKYEKVLNNLSETTDLIIAEDKLDKRTSLYKYLKKNSDFREFGAPSPSQLIDWLVKRTKELGGKLSPADARYLVQRAGVDQLKLSHEIDKLISFDPNINQASIDKLVATSPSSKIFDLLDAAFAGNKEKALKLYGEQRTQRVEPQQIIAMLAWQLNILALIKTARGLPSSLVAKQAGQNPFVIEKSSGLASKMELSALMRYIRELLELDVKSKTTNLDLDAALSNYLVSL